MQTAYDCIIVGLGGVGSAALSTLAGRGLRVLGIEQYDPAHDRGSSHGETRVIRRAYYEHFDYVPLVDRSWDRWRSLEAESGRTLMTRTGLFLTGRLDGEALHGTLRAAAQHRLAIAEVPRNEAQVRFPHLRIADDEAVVYEPDAGFLRVEDCVRTHLDVAIARGAATRFGETVREWSANAPGVTVTTDRGHYSAGRFIVAAGAWSGPLLADLGVSLVVRRKVLMWHGVSESHREDYAAGPIYLFERPEGVFYGFPCLDGETVKLGEHTGGDDVLDPDRIDRRLHDSDIRPISQFIRHCLPGVDAAPVRHTVCMYTMTPDGNFIVDRHPGHDHVVFAAGLSGHGFKFAPVLGTALADLAFEGTTDLPIDFLSLSRFAL